METRDDLDRLDDEELFDLDEAEILDDDIVSDDDEEVAYDVVPDIGGGDKPRAGELSRITTDTLSTIGAVGTGMLLNVDLTVVVDVTGSMQKLIDAIKRDITNLRMLIFDKLNENLGKKRPDRTLNKMRVRVVAFRDYNYDWEAALQPQHGPMLMSNFYDLDDEDDCAALQRFVDQLEATGGEDDPESALEALHYAFNSDWDREQGIMHRHMILMLTDAPGLPLEDERNAVNPHYPAGMPGSLAELQAEYNDENVISQRAQRLLIFAPRNVYPWNEIKHWSATVLDNVVPDSGLQGVEMERIVAALTGSI